MSHYAQDDVHGEPLVSDQRARVDIFMLEVRAAIRIPAGTRSRRCYRCPMIIYEVGKQVVSIAAYKEQPPGIAPTDSVDGCGISHWADCKDAEYFRRRGHAKQ